MEVIKKSVGRPKSKLVEPVEKKKVGRPAKIVVEPVAPKKKVGRPTKIVVEPVAPKKKVGRPSLNKPDIIVPKKMGRPIKNKELENVVIEPVELENVVVEPIEPKSKVGHKKSQASVAENALLTGLDRFGKPLSAQHLANLQIALNQLKHGVPNAEPKVEPKLKETKVEKGRKPSKNYDDAIETIDTKKYGNNWWLVEGNLSKVFKKAVKNVPIRYINGKLEVYNDGWKVRPREIFPILNNIEYPNTEFKLFFRKNMDMVRQLLIDEIVKKNDLFKVQKPKKEKETKVEKVETKVEPKPKTKVEHKVKEVPAKSFNDTNPEIEAPNDTWFKTKNGVVAMLNTIWQRPKPVKYENGTFWEWKKEEDTYYKKGEVKRGDVWVENDELIDEIIRILPIDKNNEFGAYIDENPDKLPPIIEAWIKS